MHGKCHICEETKDIKWCGACKHYFCAECRKDYWSRGYAAVMELINGRQQVNCCGPQEAV